MKVTLSVEYVYVRPAGEVYAAKFAVTGALPELPSVCAYVTLPPAMVLSAPSGVRLPVRTALLRSESVTVLVRLASRCSSR